MVDNLVPNKNRAQALDEIVRRWENFTYGILKSPAIRRELLQLQNGRCAVCSESMEPAEEQIHHTSYINLCYTSANVKGIPPCTDCSRKDRCLARLRVVHDSCHKAIHSDETAPANASNDLDSIDKTKVKFPRNRAGWSNEDIEKLTILIASKKRLTSIAIALGRSPRAIRLYLERNNMEIAKK